MSPLQLVILFCAVVLVWLMREIWRELFYRRPEPELYLCPECLSRYNTPDHFITPNGVVHLGCPTCGSATVME